MRAAAVVFYIIKSRYKLSNSQTAAMMHKAQRARAYQSITPANNMILKKKWDQSRFDMHRMKVRNAKPMIDTKPPETYMHLHLKLKKLQMEEERQSTVERDNHILLEKMAHIMRTRGRVDNRNDYQQRSLNKTRRQRDLLRVTHENQAILKRIQSKEPHYNHLQWLDQWHVNKGYMANISKYPHNWMYNGKQKQQVQKKQIFNAPKTPQTPARPSQKPKASSAVDKCQQTLPPIST